MKIKTLKFMTMIREIVKIDDNLCDGCGDCVPVCREGAIQIIDNKARLISDLMCDGLGACLGHCPQGAITIEKREAEPYNETKVMEIMIEKGKNTVIAHLKHLKEHNEIEYYKEGVNYLKKNADNTSFNVNELIQNLHNEFQSNHHDMGGCPGARTISFNRNKTLEDSENMVSRNSELSQWPIQMHLINPNAPYFQNSNLVLAADCIAYALGNFHQKYLKGNSLVIACPKLDTGKEMYLEKLKALIDQANVNTITVMIMQVPCCSGLLHMAQEASQSAERNVPVKATVVSLEGEILQEEWI